MQCMYKRVKTTTKCGHIKVFVGEEKKNYKKKL